MEASIRGLELHVQCVNSGYVDKPHPPNAQTPHSHCELRLGGSQALKAISWNKQQFRGSFDKEVFWLLAGTDWFGLVLAQWREGGRETRHGLTSWFHLHFRVGGQCDESRHHSLSYQRLIHPLHQQLIGLDRASRDVTEVGRALGQEWATPPTHREEIKKKQKPKRSEKGEGRNKEKYKKDRKKW